MTTDTPDNLGARMYASAETVTRVRGAPVAPTRPAEPKRDTTPMPTDGRAPAAAQATTAMGQRMFTHAEAPDRAPSSLDVAGPKERQATIDEILDRPESEGDRVAAAAEDPMDPTRHLGSAFDALEQTARAAGNEADAAALAEGRKLAGELLAEYGVKATDARELVGTLSTHHQKYMEAGEIDAATVTRVNADAMATLREAWGRDFNANLQMAREAARQAMKRAPWLDDLLRNSAAGSDPAVIRHFAQIGMRQRRAARRKAR